MILVREGKSQTLYTDLIYISDLSILWTSLYLHTVVWEKFNGENFHVKKFRVKIFSSS